MAIGKIHLWIFGYAFLGIPYFIYKVSCFREQGVVSRRGARARDSNKRVLAVLLFPAPDKPQARLENAVLARPMVSVRAGTAPFSFPSSAGNRHTQVPKVRGIGSLAGRAQDPAREGRPVAKRPLLSPSITAVRPQVQSRADGTTEPFWSYHQPWAPS